MISDPMLDVGSRRTMAAVLATVVAAVVMAAGLSLWAPVANAAGQVRNANAPGTVAGEYIVVFKNQGLSGTASSNRADEVAARHGGRVKHRYSSVLDGYAAEMTAAQAAKVAGDAQVEYVQQAYRVEALDVQNNPPNWGDDRIDQRDTPLNNVYEYPGDGGEGAHVYVMDTGVNLNHVEFTGRTGPGRDIVSNDADPSDCHGHGTHVAGTAAGTTYGVAKKATVHAVRVLSCAGSGSSANILAGLEWIRTNAVRPAVVNYSIGCSSPCSDPTLDNAVTTLVNGGIMWVQAAGNGNQDSCLFSPQKVPVALTVGNMDDQRRQGELRQPRRLPGRLGPGHEHHLRLVHEQHGDEHDLRHVDGLAARGRLGGPVPGAERERHIGAGARRDRRQLDAEHDHRRARQHAEPDAVHRLHERALAERDGGLAGESDGHGRHRGQPGQQRLRRHAALHVVGDRIAAGLSINASTGTISGTPTTAGNSSVTVTATDSSNPAKSGSATFAWQVNPAGTCTAQTNGTDVAIGDNTTVESPVTMSGCTGNASATSTVAVNIVHTYIGDLVVSLVAPDGSVYTLHNRTGGTTDNINQTYRSTCRAKRPTASGSCASPTWRPRTPATSTAGR